MPPDEFDVGVDFSAQWPDHRALDTAVLRDIVSRLKWIQRALSSQGIRQTWTGVPVVDIERKIQELELAKRGWPPTKKQEHICSVCGAEQIVGPGMTDPNGISVTCPNLEQQWHNWASQKTERQNKDLHTWFRRP